MSVASAHTLSLRRLPRKLMHTLNTFGGGMGLRSRLAASPRSGASFRCGLTQPCLPWTTGAVDSPGALWRSIRRCAGCSMSSLTPRRTCWSSWLGRGRWWGGGGSGWGSSVSGWGWLKLPPRRLLLIRAESLRLRNDLRSNQSCSPLHPAMLSAPAKCQP
jgi:hypothetical protein